MVTTLPMLSKTFFRLIKPASGAPDLLVSCCRILPEIAVNGAVFLFADPSNVIADLRELPHTILYLVIGIDHPVGWDFTLVSLLNRAVEAIVMAIDAINIIVESDRLSLGVCLANHVPGFVIDILPMENEIKIRQRKYRITDT